MTLPPHKCGLFLSHNEHKDYYEPLESFLKDCRAEFVSEAARQQCIATDEYWELQWYPRTPLSSYCIAAPTLEELLTYAAEVAKRNES